ncbi:MAG: hypothetical protein JWM55_230 [Acidimicrobiaceae bacterium]|nr:hypothetical protein [Acidimicrobiaceae bacterium]
MRRVLAAAVVVAVSLGFFTLPSGADLGIPSNVVLSFNFSDNSFPASISTGPNNLNPFNVIADVVPQNTGGVIRMVAIAPASSTVNNLVCSFQPVQQGEVECAFNFTADGVWTVRAQYATDSKSGVSSVSSTSLRVAN